MKDTTVTSTFLELLSENDLGAYVRRMADPSLFEEIPLPAAIDYSSLMRAKRSVFPFSKQKWVKRWFADQQSGGFLRGVKLHLPFISKRLCCMDDDGNVLFAFRIFFRKSESIVKFAFHETAHLWLSTQSFYAELLALDKAYLDRFGTEQTILCLSPLEHLASHLSVAMLRQATAVAENRTFAKALERQVETEEKKLADCIAAFGASREIESDDTRVAL